MRKTLIARTAKATRAVSWMTLMMIAVMVDPLIPRKAMYPVRAAKITTGMIDCQVRQGDVRTRVG